MIAYWITGEGYYNIDLNPNARALDPRISQQYQQPPSAASPLPLRLQIPAPKVRQPHKVIPCTYPRQAEQAVPLCEGPQLLPRSQGLKHEAIPGHVEITVRQSCRDSVLQIDQRTSG